MGKTGRPIGRPIKLYEIGGFKAPARWWARQLDVSSTCLYYHMHSKGLTFEAAYQYLKEYIEKNGRHGYNVHRNRIGRQVVPKEKK